MLSLEAVIAGALLFSLTLYVLSGGADFGGGVWDLFAGGERKKQQVEAIESALGPIWEVNHVWLILVVVILFVAFPPAFAQIMTALHLPLTVMLIGIVLRGSAFTFRHYDQAHSWFQAYWGRLFASASIVTPIMLGICVGSIADGGVGRVSPTDPHWYLRAWCAPFPLLIGFFTLSLFALLAGVYLTVEASDPGLKEDFRQRSLWAALVAGFFAFTALFVIQHENLPLKEFFLSGRNALLFQLGVGSCAVLGLVSLWCRWYRVARLATIAQVILILWGWAFSQYPMIIPPGVTFLAVAAPKNVLWLLLEALLVGMVLLIPSLWYLYRIFKGPPLPHAKHSRLNRQIGE